MSIRYTKSFLQGLEELVGEAGYILRYEKGNFQAGYCILKSRRIIVVNKFFTLEGKINCLIDIIRDLNIDEEQLSNASRKLLIQIRQLSLS
ncbi:hypothetical protein FHS56_000089 [Thermonema lapsum]|jgi:hypothetical protein|uniref:Uncharacterized protein n=1 Tax=Thermonema lapsum TaxID=28195 RepID=A0A846MM36_9BACT|nr:hypothetical protein [Thermonema lapsum]NIK72603.1 hypothetical protein [Thermonema lapsum]